MYNMASVLIFLGFLTMTGYGKPVPKSGPVADDRPTTEDVKLNTCAADVIRLIAQQEKTHQVDFSILSDECRKLVKDAMQYAKEMNTTVYAPDQNVNKREDNGGSADDSVSEESSVAVSEPGTDNWKVTVDNVLYHLLKALEFEHEKLQKTLKWIAELQDNQNQLVEDKFPGLTREKSEESGEYALHGNRNEERKRTTEDSKGSPADRMKEFYNDLTTGDLRELMENKPPSFKPKFNENQEPEEKELGVDGEESASETPDEEGKEEIEVGESASETPDEEVEPEDDRGVERGDSASETPDEEVEPEDDRGVERGDSASETPDEEVEPEDDRGFERGDSASETPDEEEGKEIEVGESASETPDEQEVEMKETTDVDANKEEQRGIEGEDSASEIPEEEDEEEEKEVDREVNEKPEEEAEDEEESVDREDSASEIPEEAEEGGVGREEFASKTPTEEEGINRDDEEKEREHNEIGNGFVTNTAEQKLVENNKLEKADDNMVQGSNRKKWNDIEGNELHNEEIKREPEVVVKSSNDLTNIESYIVESDVGVDGEHNQETEVKEYGNNEDLKDTVVNELKGLKERNHSGESDRMRAVVEALQKLSGETQSDTH